MSKLVDLMTEFESKIDDSDYWQFQKEFMIEMLTYLINNQDTELDANPLSAMRLNWSSRITEYAETVPKNQKKAVLRVAELIKAGEV